MHDFYTTKLKSTGIIMPIGKIQLSKAINIKIENLGRLRYIRDDFARIPHIDCFVSSFNCIKKSSKNVIKELSPKEFAAKKKIVLPKIQAIKTLNVKKNNINKYNIYLIEKIADNSTSLLRNQNFKANVNSIIRETTTSSEAKAKMNIINKFLETPQLMKSPKFATIIGDTARATKTPEEARLKIELIDKIITSPEDYAGYTEYIIDSKKTRGVIDKINLDNAIISDSEQDKYIANELKKISSSIFTENNLAEIEFLKELKTFPELMKNKNFKKYLVYFSPSTESINAKIDLIKILKQYPDLLQNKNITENIAEIISYTSYRERVDDIKKIIISTFDINQNLTANLLLNPDLGGVLADYPNLLKANNINELNIADKRTFLKILLSKYNTMINKPFDKEACLIPRNNDEYYTLLQKLVQSIGVDIRPLSKETKLGYFKAMDNIEKYDGAFRTTNLESPDFKLELKYSRENFMSDIQKMISKVSSAEQNKVMDYFGFEIKQTKDGILRMNGYPINVNNEVKMAEIDNPATKEIIEKIRPLVTKFSEQNEISIKNNPELAKNLNDIIGVFPEFLTIIGKKQYKTHDFTLDVHTLKVLQGVMNNPHYQNLPIADKRALQIATLMHDLTKTEWLIDKTHPECSAFDTYYLLKKMNMTESEKLKIYQIIKNHDWLERYNAKVQIGDMKRDLTNNERIKISQDIAFELRHGNSFKMASILAEADLKGVKRNNAFFGRYSDVITKGNDEISQMVKYLQSTAIHLPQTKLPKASMVKVNQTSVKEIEINGVKNKVLYLSPNVNAQELGFNKDFHIEDLNILVHGLEGNKDAAIFNVLGAVDSDALFSTSYINYGKGNYHVFRQQGFVLDVASEDIHVAYYKDFGSGSKKDLKLLKDSYLFSGENNHIREYISKLLKEKLNLSDDEYISLFAKISNKSLEKIDRLYPKISATYRELFTNMENGKRSYSREYNEILVGRPKIQGVFVQNQKIELIPEFLRKYASGNDLPIIVFE